MTRVALTPKRHRGRPARLTRERVMAAALRITDREGAASLTVRGVARACGVTPMAIYRHAEDIEKLRDLAVDAALQDFPDIEFKGAWRQKARALYGAVRQVLLKHPGAAAIFSARATPTLPVVRITDLALSVMEEAGFQGRDVVLAYDALTMFTYGCVRFELTRDRSARGRLLGAHIPKGEMRFVEQYADKIADRDPDGYFESGLELVLDGLEARISRDRQA